MDVQHVLGHNSETKAQIKKKTQNMLPTFFGHIIRRNQHCINMRSRLDSAASFVLNQLQNYNIRDCEMKWKSRCIHLGTLPSIVFVCKNKEIEVSGQFKLCSWAHVFLKADLSNPQWHTLIATFAWNSSLSSCQYTKSTGRRLYWHCRKLTVHLQFNYTFNLNRCN